MNNETLLSTLTVKASAAVLLTDNFRERAAWITAHGPANPDYVEIRLTAPADLWADAGITINADGSVHNPKNCCGMGLSDVPSDMSSDIRAFLSAAVASDGPLKADYDATPMVSKIIQRLTDAKAEREARIAREEKTQQEKKNREDAAEAERLAWIAANGSDRLRRCIAEGIECAAVYRDERLALERIGWVWLNSLRGDTTDPRNPPASAFDLLDEARKACPIAKLQFYKADAETDDVTGDETAPAVRAYVAESEFLGYTIVFGAPKE